MSSTAPTAEAAAVAAAGRAVPGRDALGWSGPLVAAAVGAALRLPRLGQPADLVFDETYYVKDALGLLRFGAERATVEGADEALLAGAPSVADADVFLDSPAFVVHPPVGKWLIGIGELAFGVNPFGWRIVGALVGVASIVLLGRIVRRLTGNSLLGTLAAGLLALDGLHIVMSRTALLDIFLMVFVLAAFGALLIDRDSARLRYGELGPAAGRRWLRGWRLTAGVLLGLACGVKWSGLWYVAAFGLLTLAWEAGNLRRAGAGRPWRSALLHDAPTAFVSLVVVGAGVYLLTWTGWLVGDGGWGRDWSAGFGYLPQPLQALLHYHASIYRFHIGLAQDHAYEAPAWGWLVQARPTSFSYNGDGTACGADRCSAAVTSLGNPVIWWAAVLALVHQTYRAIMVRDPRSAAAVVAVLAGWAPWLLLPERTMFAFYAVTLLPFLVAGLTMSLGQVLAGPADTGRRWRIAAVGAFLFAVVAAAWWFMPVWLGEEIPYEAWRQRMWLRSWI